jgi:DNA-binding MltR family transcriptional regulator
MASSHSADKIKELNLFLQEFQNESDRGAALLGAAMIDDYLRRVITAYLIDRKKIVRELLIGGNAPLSTFSARNKMAYCLGLISRCEYFNIDTIRDIRNKFAHQLHGLSFDDKEIVKLCRKLKFDESSFGIINLPTPRHSFTLATAVIVANLNQINVNHLSVKAENDDWKPMRGLKW